MSLSELNNWKHSCDDFKMINEFGEWLRNTKKLHLAHSTSGKFGAFDKSDPTLQYWADLAYEFLGINKTKLEVERIILLKGTHMKTQLDKDLSIIHNKIRDHQGDIWFILTGQYANELVVVFDKEKFDRMNYGLQPYLHYDDRTFNYKGTVKNILTNLIDLRTRELYEQRYVNWRDENSEMCI